MDYSFAGYIVQPTTIHTVGALILDSQPISKVFAQRFARQGCLTIALDSMEPSDAEVKEALKALYRYCEHIILIGLHDEASHVCTFADEENMVDYILSFSPSIMPMQSEKTIRIFADADDAMHTNVTDYKKDDLTLLLDSSIDTPSSLWERIEMIIQFI